MDFLQAFDVEVVSRSGNRRIVPQWVQAGNRAYEWAPQPLPPHREIVITFRPGIKAAECRFHHGVLPRMVGKGVARGDEAWKESWHSPLTGEVHFEELVGGPGFGIYPPFVLLPDEGVGWIFGPTSEERARCLWEWFTESDGMLTIRARLIPWGLDGDLMEGPLSTEGWFCAEIPAGETLGPTIFEGYNQALQRRLGPTPAQRHTDPGLTWATWNDGTFRDIDEQRIFDLCDYLQEHHPAIRWVQADDGWAGPESVPYTDDGSLAMSDFGVFYKPERLEGDPRFPGGLKGLADGIRARGFRPLLWLTPAVADGSDLYREHPEWFLQEARLSWMPEMRFLDFSVPETRAFVERALDLVFCEWGFEGTKLDFWTMTFEETNVRLANHDHTAIEWMSWFMEAIRKRIPEDGLVLHCIGLPFGGPFRAKWCDHFRYYADSEGSCGVQEMVREQALWAAFLLGLYGVQRFWIPNGDGFGLFDHIHLPENEHRRWAAFMLGSGSTTEICGWLHQKTDTEALERVRIVCENARLGGRIELPGYDFEQDPPHPPSVWVRHDLDGGLLIGLANWTDEPVEFVVPGAGELVELFTRLRVVAGETIVLPAREGRVLVPAGGG